MTKRVFEAFAKRINDDITTARQRFGAAEGKRTEDAAAYAAHLFADVASLENPRFDRTRFLRACGLLQQGEVR